MKTWPALLCILLSGLLAACGDDDSSGPSGGGDSSSSSAPDGAFDPDSVVRGTLIDARDSAVYPTVKIAGQVWMARNLRFVTAGETSWPVKAATGTPTLYGRYYLWSAVMDSAGVHGDGGAGCGNGKTCSPAEPARGICPEGWHVPTVLEFEELFRAVGGSYNAGTKLKSDFGWAHDDWHDADGNGEDLYGFTALPMGMYMPKDVFGYRNDSLYATFWTATESSASTVHTRGFSNEGTNAVDDVDDKANALPVRCVKD